jgi:hypothetical protein
MLLLLAIALAIFNDSVVLNDCLGISYWEAIIDLTFRGNVLSNDCLG